jgi:hypothetical protein
VKKGIYLEKKPFHQDLQLFVPFWLYFWTNGCLLINFLFCLMCFIFFFFFKKKKRENGEVGNGCITKSTSDG